MSTYIKQNESDKDLVGFRLFKSLHTNKYCQDNVHFFIDFFRDPYGFVMRLIPDQYVWGLDFFFRIFFHSCCDVGPRVNIYNDSYELCIPNTKAICVSRCKHCIKIKKMFTVCALCYMWIVSSQSNRREYLKDIRYVIKITLPFFFSKTYYIFCKYNSFTV